MADTNTTTTTVNCCYCEHRLPCGICRLTMSQCPKAWYGQPHITWTTSTASGATINSMDLSGDSTSCTCHMHGGDEA